jgi:hypothetical protein
MSCGRATWFLYAVFAWMAFVPNGLIARPEPSAARRSDAVGLRAAFLIVPALWSFWGARGALGARRLRPVEALGKLDDAQPEPPGAQ